MTVTQKAVHRFFKLTRSAINSYKADDPLETTRNPRPDHWNWDVDWGIWMWFATVLLTILAILTDIILLLFPTDIWQTVILFHKSNHESCECPPNIMLGIPSVEGCNT